MDTNLWSYVAKSDAVGRFDSAAAESGITIVTPPSVLLEVLGTRNRTHREAIIRALCNKPRYRPPSEAESMSNELVSEIRRLHPQWLRSMPDTARVATLHGFWTKRIWRLAQQGFLGDRQFGPPSEQEQRRLITGNQKTNASNAKKESVDLRNFAGLKAFPTQGDASGGKGWRDDRPIDLWRAENALLYWYQLITVPSRAIMSGEDTTFADWVGAYVNLNLVRRKQDEFYAMWFYEIEPAAVLRNWVGWAVTWAQMQRRIEISGATDAQHASYLCDCDVFLTADKRFAHALQLVAEQAPAPVASTRLVVDPGAGNIVERIFDAFGTDASSRPAKG
jgi:hypothetical protein